jgi:SAM-dependent methyltransferase
MQPAGPVPGRRRAGGPAVTAPDEGWAGMYAREAPPAWDIGRPQAAFTVLARRGLLGGRVLDAGCGTGEHTLLAAAHGAEATGVDLVPLAIDRARAKAADRGLTARFEVGDVLDLPALGESADTVIDCGVFHVFDDDARARYVASLAAALEPGGTCYLMCFSDLQPGDFGPRRVSQDELRAAFSAGWAIDSIAGETFELNPRFGVTEARSWLAAIRRG